MSKRAEQAAKEIYKDGIELLGRRDKSGNLIIHPEIMVGILRNACRRGYEQAEKDLALTWEDVQLLDSFVLELVCEERGGKDWGDGREFYTEVLTRFKQFKEDNK